MVRAAVIFGYIFRPVTWLNNIELNLSLGMVYSFLLGLLRITIYFYLNLACCYSCEF